MTKDFPRSDLAPGYSISQVLKGSWQLSEGHSQKTDEQQAIEDMRTFVAAGITTFDCADIYTGVEELIGKFLNKYKYRLLTYPSPGFSISSSVSDIFVSSFYN